MLKLIKYEWLHTYRSFGLVFALFIIGCVAFPLLPLDIGLTIASFAIVISIGIMIAVFVTVAKNYGTSMFKKPGYLTLTLPVSTHTLILSKLIAAVLWYLIAMMIMIVGLMISTTMISAKIGVSLDLLEIFNELIQIINLAGWQQIFQSILFLVLSIVSSILGLFTLITILQTKYTRNHKVIIGIAIFVIYSFLIAFINNQVLPSLGMTGIVLTMVVLGIEIILFYCAIFLVIDRKLEIE